MSQSGETADTLAALRHCLKAGMKSAAHRQHGGMTIAREVGCDLAHPLRTRDRRRSTKAFTAQVSVLTVLAIAAARDRGRIDEVEEKRLSRS